MCIRMLYLNDMNKRGQFFLVAAIIIIGFIVSIATATNTIKVGPDNEAFYDLSKEVGFETKRVLDYGVYTPTEEGTFELTRDFLEQYADYLAQDQVVFIYGDSSELQALNFEGNIEEGFVGISTGIGIEPTGIILYDLIGRPLTLNHDLPNNRVIVDVNGINYDFDLREGQDFFFVIVKHEDGEKFVAAG
jgi:hypothetical protein